MKKRTRPGIGRFLLKGLKRKPARPVSRRALPRFRRKAVKAPARPEVVQETAPVQKVLPAPLPAASAPTPDPLAVSLARLIRPDEKLQHSIQGFLLDQRSEHTRRAYGKDLKRFIQFLISRTQDPRSRLENLTRHHIIAYKDSLLAEGLQHTTVDRHLATLRSFFQWLVDDGHLAKNPAEGVRFLNPKRLSTTIGFSDEEVRKILKLPNLHTRTGSLHYAILMILFYCGLRRSEVCSLRTSNLSTERGQKVLRLRGKGNSERIIPLIAPVWSAIQHFSTIAARPLSGDHWLFAPIRNNRTGVRDKSLDPSMVFYIVTRYAREAGVANRVSPHSCRATAISNARDHDVPDRAIQEFAGWASPAMITRYDKRKTAVEDSAAHAIRYGAEDRKPPSQARPEESEESRPPEGRPIDGLTIP